MQLLNEFLRILKPEGILYLMTDVEEVDEMHKEILTQHNGFSFTYVEDGAWDLTAKTYQEEFCLSKNIPFTRMICRLV